VALASATLKLVFRHLLGKKSWNVYNTDNIERVRRDEAIAREKELAEEERQQEEDAARRLAILRGEIPPPVTDAPRELHSFPDPADGSGRGSVVRKPRKRAGEDDTEFEMRVATQQWQQQGSARLRDIDDKQNASNKRQKVDDAPLTGTRGHIDLFPEAHQGSQPVTEKNAEAQQEAGRKQQKLKEQYNMHFSNAAGKDGLSSAGPWYAAGGDLMMKAEKDGAAVVGKDVWGNEDPRRRDREAARVVQNDPLAMMKRGAAKVREVDRERRAANEERERELRTLRREERRARRGEGRRRGKGDDDDDELEGFTLDGERDAQTRKQKRWRSIEDDRDREERRRHHRHRHRDHDRGKDRDKVDHDQRDREESRRHSGKHDERDSGRRHGETEGRSRR
jgi:hypothetical protein